MCSASNDASTEPNNVATGVTPIQWSVYDLVMGQGDDVSIPPFGTGVGHGYVDGLLAGSALDREAGRPHTHTPCCCDNDGFMRLAPGRSGAQTPLVGGSPARSDGDGCCKSPQ